MNPKAIAEDLKNADPETSACFMFVPGRYYVAMWCVKLPNELSIHGFGGDIVFLLWCKNDEPQTWYIRYRFRHYKDDGDNPWDGQDTKNWYGMRVDRHTQAEAEAKLMQTIGLLIEAMRTSETLECFRIEGDCDKAFQELERQKPHWMHVKVQTIT